ncbi:ribonuclease HI family protein [Turneriella parva]|uniref:ribonuclease HI family protein n=1 Tax=Turneriella parva TaxID=29510 RepID=UPI0012F6EB2B|nr:ribonuclease HI family protein [Turneriella parva]
MSEPINIYCDGASRGNPGPASFGVAAFSGNEDVSLGRFKNDEKTALFTIEQKLGNRTNNEAEYAAILAALNKCIELKIEAPRLISDSELVIRQLQGRYKVKGENLKGPYAEALRLAAVVKPQLVHVPREKNQIADFLANRALDTP